MKKTEKINKSLAFIEQLDMSSLELDRLISELESMADSKEDEEYKEFVLSAGIKDGFEPKNEKEAETKEELSYNGK